jgi:cytidine deaminase
MHQPCLKIQTNHIDNVVSYGYNCYRGSTSTSSNATIHAEHSAINKLKYLEKKKKLVKINILVIKISSTGLISMSKPCNHCINILQLIANKKGYYISNIFFSNNMRKIEKWSYTDLENDPEKHVTEFYKNSTCRNNKK